MSILAIDPGSTRSAWIVLRPDDTPAIFGRDANLDVLAMCGQPMLPTPDGQHVLIDELVIEWMTPRGMPTSAEEFETLWWIGRFTQAAGSTPVARLARGKVKDHLCGNRQANDANIRAAIIDRFGGLEGKAAAIGTTKSRGPLYGISNDVWAALGVALTYADDPSLVYVPKVGAL